MPPFQSGVGRECERTEGITAVPAEGEGTSCQRDSGRVVHRIICRDEKGTSGGDHDLRVAAERVGGSGYECAGVGVRRAECGSGTAILDEASAGDGYGATDRGIARSGESEVLGAGNAAAEDERAGVDGRCTVVGAPSCGECNPRLPQAEWRRGTR